MAFDPDQDLGDWIVVRLCDGVVLAEKFDSENDAHIRCARLNCSRTQADGSYIVMAAEK